METDNLSQNFQTISDSKFTDSNRVTLDQNQNQLGYQISPKVKSRTPKFNSFHRLRNTKQGESQDKMHRHSNEKQTMPLKQVPLEFTLRQKRQKASNINTNTQYSQGYSSLSTKIHTRKHRSPDKSPRNVSKLSRTVNYAATAATANVNVLDQPLSNPRTEQILKDQRPSQGKDDTRSIQTQLKGLLQGQQTSSASYKQNIIQTEPVNIDRILTPNPPVFKRENSYKDIYKADKHRSRPEYKFIIKDTPLISTIDAKESLTRKRGASSHSREVNRSETIQSSSKTDDTQYRSQQNQNTGYSAKWNRKFKPFAGRLEPMTQYNGGSMMEGSEQQNAIYQETDSQQRQLNSIAYTSQGSNLIPTNEYQLPQHQTIDDTYYYSKDSGSHQNLKIDVKKVTITEGTFGDFKTFETKRQRDNSGSPPTSGPKGYRTKTTVKSTHKSKIIRHLKRLYGGELPKVSHGSNYSKLNRTGNTFFSKPKGGLSKFETDFHPPVMSTLSDIKYAINGSQFDKVGIYL